MKDRAVTWFALACIAVAVCGRGAIVVHKLAAPQPALSVFEEDGFYIFSVARNLAAGHGPTADGQHWTNGFQPLWTLVSAALYAVGGGDRVSFALLYALSFALWLTSAWLFARLVRSLQPDASPALPLYAAAWFLSDPTLQWNAFSGMETGAYVCAILFVLTLRRRDPWRLGLALGLLFWVRNDAVLLVAPWLLVELKRGREVVKTSAVAAVVFAPWIAFNLWLGGSPVPQSGAAISVGVNAMAFGSTKLRLAFDIIADYLLEPLAPVSRLPLAFRWLAAALVLGALAWSARAVLRRFWPMAAGALLVCSYYIFGSGAHWYFLRYFVPFKLVLLVAAMGLLAQARRPILFLALAITTFAGVHRWPFLYHSDPHLGADIAALAEHHVRRVGMFESGRSGYFLDGKIVNLDGKVNFEALSAVRQGRFYPYLRSLDLDGLYFRDYDRAWLDAYHPEWRADFGPGEEWAGPGKCVFYPKKSSRP